MSLAPDVAPREGTMVVRGERVVYASDGLAALAARPAGEIVGFSPLDLVVPEDRARLLELRARATAGEPIPRSLELTLLLPDGGRRPVEAHADQDGPEIIVHVRDLGAAAARRLRLEAIAAIGAAVRKERSEEGVHARVSEELGKLGLASAMMRRDGDAARIVWISIPAHVRSEFVARLGVAPEGFVGPLTAFGARALAEGAAFTDDWAEPAARFLPPGVHAVARALIQREGLTRAVAVRVDPTNDDALFLVIGGPWLRSEDVPAVRLFGAQVAAALDAAGIIAELSRQNLEVRRRLADLEAVHELALRVHANAPGDLRALLRDGCDGIARALSARMAGIFLASDDRTALRAAASVGVPRIAEGTRVDLARDPFSAEVLRDRLPCTSEDITRDPRSIFHGRSDIAPLSMLAVPLASRAEVRGVVYVGDVSGRRFSSGDVALANALAGALAVGIENAELYADVRRRVEELFILNEVGRAVAGSLDLAEVIRGAAEGARRIARTTRAYLLRHDAARGELRFGGGAGTDDAALADLVCPATGGTVIDRVLRERHPMTVEDVERSPDVSPIYRTRLGGRAFAAVPVVLRGEALGVLVADDERGPRRFAEADVEQLTAVADRLALAMENARLYLETRRRAEELGLLHEVGRSLVETLDIEQVLRAGVRNLARIVDAPDAYLMLATEDGQHLEVRAVAGNVDPGLQRLRLPSAPADGNLAARAFAAREPIVVQDALVDPRVRQELRARQGGRAYLVLPLVVRDRAIGAVVIIENRGPRLFTPPEVERAAAIGNQLAVAADNARLYEDLRRSYAELARAQRQIIQGERLAALGELSAVVAHEVRNPLGVIFNSLGSLRRLVQPSGDARMLFDIMEEEADRLNRIVGDLLDFARPSKPEVRPELLDRVVEEAVVSAVAQHDARIEIARDIDASVPPVAMDARLVRQAVLNVASNAVQAMPRGGRITIRTRRDGDQALLEVEDTGVGITDEVRARIFEPFFTTKASGTGLGLAVVKRIVEGHGGAVAVRSTPGVGTVFALRFPLGGPQGP